MHVKIPPPIQTLIAALIMLAVDYFFPVDLYPFEEGAILVVGTLCLIGVLLLLPAAFSFWKNKTTVNPLVPEKATVLVVEGVYKYTRNPMYLGMAAILSACGVCLSNPLNFLVLGLYMYVMTLIQIRPEERALEKLFEEQFVEYSQRVRRWL